MIGGVLGAAAAASIPSPMWAEVERVVIACHFDTSIASPSVRRSLCDQIVAEASRLTTYPVSLADPRDLKINPARLQRQDRQLILHIGAASTSGGTRPSEVMLTIRPERVGLRHWQGSATRPYPVNVEWTNHSARLRGPIAPLALFLMEPRRNRDLPVRRHPVRGDQ